MLCTFFAPVFIKTDPACANLQYASWEAGHVGEIFLFLRYRRGLMTPVKSRGVHEGLLNSDPLSALGGILRLKTDLS